ncbi:hypothetical protein EDB80DRAFT_869588 [Ilyonectria destructans]|nr:hypothetical protein EDB80DRAFT_869588 [Ilyonectria destructans]
MRTESNSHIWDSRFTDDAPATSAAAAGSRSRANPEADNLLQDVMVIVRNRLPHVVPEFLRFDSGLGQGSSFEVTKEVLSNWTGKQPHFVAVKRLAMRRHTDNLEESAAEINAESRRLISVKRELRVLTHPKL